MHYDAATGLVVIDLLNGCTFSFPPKLVEGLHDASEEEIADVEISASGFGLHWPQLDEDYSVPGLMKGIFGTAKLMATKAERSTSPAKAAARANGAKGC